MEGAPTAAPSASGEIPKIPLNLALLKGCDIVGVFWGTFIERARHGQVILRP